MDTFEENCKNAVTGLDLMNIAGVFHQILFHSYNRCNIKDNCSYCAKRNFMDSINAKRIYNDYIGWALASEKACRLVVNEWQKDPSRNIVDLGAGTGVFCLVFHHLGIPADKLIAVDIENPTHTTAFGGTTKSSVRKNFWPIVRNNDYKPDPNDILFIAWGAYIDDVVTDYVKRGGKCVIILGETNVSYDPETFIEETDWIADLHHVPGPSSIHFERLSINKKV